MSRSVHIEITEDRIVVRGNLDEFEATAYLQEAFNLQVQQKERARKLSIWAIGSELFSRYQALIVYPLAAAFVIGAGLAFHMTPNPQPLKPIQENYYVPR